MKVFENDADWEERAWELAKKLVSIDSSDPGAYEGEIGERLYEYLSRCCERCGGSLADQIQIAREEVLPGRFNVMARIPGKTNGPGLIYICHMDTVMLGDGWMKRRRLWERWSGKQRSREKRWCACMEEEPVI